MLEKHIWDALPRQLLEEVLEPEMAKQYRIRRGEQCRFMPVSAEEAWLCACGEENRRGTVCACGLEEEPLTRQLLEQLSRDAEIRLRQEEEERRLREQREAEARKAAEAKARREKRKRILIRVGIGLLCLAFLAGMGLLTWKVILPAVRYRSALKALEQGHYEEAYGKFLRAGDWKDAKDYLERFSVQVTTEHTATVYDENYDWSFMGVTPADTEIEIRYTYDGGGRILHRVESGSGTQEYTYRYDDEGRVLESTDRDGRVVYTYDEHGSVLTMNHERTDSNYSYTKTWSYVYDDQGRILESMEVCNDFITVNYSYESRIQNTYDERGLLIRQENHINYPATADACYTMIMEWEYDAAGRPVRCRHTITFLYNSAENGNGLETWTYDDQGRQIGYTMEMQYPMADFRDFLQTEKTVYDGAGRVTEQTSSWRYPNDERRNYEQSSRTEYDDEGRTLREQRYIRYEDPTWQSMSGKEQVDTWTYDRQGRLTEHVQEYTAQPDQSYVQRERFSYKGLVPESSEKICVYPQQEDSNWESKSTYDENGQVKTLWVKEPGYESTTEYTYAYFYYPEGTEPPNNE